MLTLLFSAATSTVLPDMLLAKAVVMTSPLVATLGVRPCRGGSGVTRASHAGAGVWCRPLHHDTNVGDL